MCGIVRHIVSRTVQYQDDWGSGRKARRISHYPDGIQAIPFDQLPFYGEVIRSLSKREWQVFNLYFTEKIESSSEIANRLGLNQTNDVRTYIKRISAKMARLNSNLEIIKVRIPESEDDDGCENAVLLSRHQLSRSHLDTTRNPPVCRDSAPWCQERTTP